MELGIKEIKRKEMCWHDASSSNPSYGTCVKCPPKFHLLQGGGNKVSSFNLGAEYMVKERS